MRGQMTHPDTEALAEFRAGLTTGRRGARIAAHLAGCDRCTALDARIAGVSALLTSVPAPPMPDSVTRRLDTVLAAEVARRNDPERSGREPGEPAEPPRRAGNRGFRLLSLRVLAPAAAAVLAAGGFGLSQVLHGPAAQMPAASSAAARAAPQGAVAAAGSAASQGSAAAKSVSGANRAAPTAASQPSPAGVPSSAAAGTGLKIASGFMVVTTGTDFAKATLAQQVAAEFRVRPAASSEHPASPQLRACVQLVVGRATLIRVLAAHYQGQPATVIVARAGPGDVPRASQGDTVWVVGPGCSGTQRDLLDQASLP